MLAETFAPDRRLRIDRSEWCRVVRFLGEGSQGAVYAVETREHAEPCALKWYHPWSSTPAQRNTIEMLIERGAPDDRFLWPTRVVDADQVAGFGYLMPLRPEGYVCLGDLLRGKVSSDYALLATLGRELADALLALHAEGLCYRDINFANVFVDPTTGRALIADTDNVGIDGASTSAVLGSRRFMAPEIVRGEAEPSTATDLHSLAVLLFYLLMVGHPLLGRRELEYPCWDEGAEREMFGISPLFVFDPHDDSNAPLPGVHDAVLRNWPLYPDFVTALFMTSFTAGVRDPDERVRESVWRAAMTQLGDLVGQCSHCGERFLLDADGSAVGCWSCDRVPEEPLRLQFDDAFVVLTEDKVLYRHHVDRSYDFSETIAEVTQHPRRPGTWGLCNSSTSAWHVTLPTGQRHDVNPGGSIGMVRGATFDFGSRTATLL